MTAPIAADDRFAADPCLLSTRTGTAMIAARLANRQQWPASVAGFGNPPNPTKPLEIRGIEPPEGSEPPAQEPSAAHERTHGLDPDPLFTLDDHRHPSDVAERRADRHRRRGYVAHLRRNSQVRRDHERHHRTAAVIGPMCRGARTAGRAAEAGDTRRAEPFFSGMGDRGFSSEGGLGRGSAGLRRSHSDTYRVTRCAANPNRGGGGVGDLACSRSRGRPPVCAPVSGVPRTGGGAGSPPSDGAGRGEGLRGLSETSRRVRSSAARASVPARRYRHRRSRNSDTRAALPCR